MSELRAELADATVDLEASQIHRLELARVLVFVGVPYLLFSGCYNLVSERRVLGISCLVIAVVISVLHLRYKNTTATAHAPARTIGVIIAGCFFAYIYAAGLGPGTGVIWVLIFPTISIYLLGLRRGMIWAVVVITAAIGLSFFSSGPALLDIHSPINLLRVGYAYCALLAFNWGFERARARADANYQKRNHDLAVKIEQLEETQEKLRDAMELAEAGSKAKSMFLAKMSHEIRTPMNGVHGMTHLLLDTSLSEDQIEIANTIQMSTRSLQKVLNDVLDFSKIEAGHMELVPDSMKVRSLCERVHRLMKDSAHEKGLELRLDVSKNVPQHIMADASRLTQILINLMGNAIKFTEQGYVSLSVRLQEDRLRWEVEDTGPGIAAQNKERLFQAFDQGSQHERFTGGTGLGLAICKDLVDLMGGEIDALNRPRGGAVFWFEIPAVQSSPKAGARQTPGRGVNKPSSKCRVLVAEDNPVNRRVVKGVLQRLGYQSTVVTNGQEAVDVHQEQTFDLILMDVQMPVVDGLEATAMIRSLSCEKSRVPIIALTANAFSDARKQCFDAGMDDFLPKPFERKELALKLQHWLNESKREGAASRLEAFQLTADMQTRSAAEREPLT